MCHPRNSCQDRDLQNKVLSLLFTGLNFIHQIDKDDTIFYSTILDDFISKNVVNKMELKYCAALTQIFTMKFKQ